MSGVLSLWLTTLWLTLLALVISRGRFWRTDWQWLESSTNICQRQRTDSGSPALEQSPREAEACDGDGLWRVVLGKSETSLGENLAKVMAMR